MTQGTDVTRRHKRDDTDRNHNRTRTRTRTRTDENPAMAYDLDIELTESPAGIPVPKLPAFLKTLVPPTTMIVKAVTQPQCSIDVSGMLYDSTGGPWEFQGGVLELKLLQTIYYDSSLDACDRTWILKHEQKHVKEYSKVFHHDFEKLLRKDARFKELSHEQTLTGSAATHEADMGRCVSRVFGAAMVAAGRRIDSKSEYKRVEDNLKKYCSGGSSWLPSFSIVRRGKSGGDVPTVQKLLNAWIAIRRAIPGPRLEVDGICGNKTVKKVEQLQSFCFLTPDGIVGPKTWVPLMLMFPLI